MAQIQINFPNVITTLGRQIGPTCVSIRWNLRKPAAIVFTRNTSWVLSRWNFSTFGPEIIAGGIVRGLVGDMHRNDGWKGNSDRLLANRPMSFRLYGCFKGKICHGNFTLQLQDNMYVRTRLLRFATWPISLSITTLNEINPLERKRKKVAKTANKQLKRHVLARNLACRLSTHAISAWPNLRGWNLANMTLTLLRSPWWSSGARLGHMALLWRYIDSECVVAAQSCEGNYIGKPCSLSS